MKLEHTKNRPSDIFCEKWKFVTSKPYFINWHRFGWKLHIPVQLPQQSHATNCFYITYEMTTYIIETWYLVSINWKEKCNLCPFDIVPFGKHLFEAHCKNQRCLFQYAWPTGNWTCYLCPIVALVLPLMVDRITRRAEIVRFHQCQGRCGNCPLWALYLMPSLGCSQCTKTSGCLWSRVASCCPKKIFFFLNKWQQRREKVTLSLHSSFSSDCYALTSAEYIYFFWVDTYQLSFLGGRYKKIPRDRGDALHINSSTERRVYCINIEGSGLLHIQLPAQTLRRAVGISSLYVSYTVC